MVGLEIFLHLRPELIPNAMLPYLSPTIRGKLAGERGIFVSEILDGENMLYHYKPNLNILKYPSVKVDDLGYRNSTELSNHHVDVVILGDSLLLSLGTKNDFGDLFRERGYSAVNLSMNGYGPQHYSESYKKFIIEKNISHDYVLVFLFFGNDIEDAVKYEKAFQEKGSYSGYLEMKRTKYYKFLPWTVNMARGLPLIVFNFFQKQNSSRININLPYGSISTFKDWWYPVVKESDPGWQYTKKALEEINLLVEEKGAKLIIFLIPSPPRLYSPFGDYFKKYDEPYLNFVRLVKKYFEKNEVAVVDTGEMLRSEIAKNFIFLTEEECHFNDLGVQKLFELAFNLIKKI